MPTPLTLTTRDDGGRITVVAAGEIDLSNNAAFAQALTEATEAAGDERVTIDLREVEFLDSGAITTLFNHVDDIHLVAGPLLMPILTISGLTELATIERSD